MTRVESEKLQTPLRIGPAFFKAHGHGNDYLVFEEGAGPVLTRGLAVRICDRHRGPGGDGIVVLENVPESAEPRLRMFNPDGGEFERSGNGLRIAGVHLRRLGRAGDGWFPVTVGGDRVRLRVGGTGEAGAWDASVEMGKVGFPDGPPFVRADRVDPRGMVVLALPSPSGGERRLTVVPVSVGNPHAVAFGAAWTRAEVEHYGPRIGAGEAFPMGTNVQFATVPAGRDLPIRIWERGVGPTLSSGTSACAAVAAAVKRGLLSPGTATVRMEGGDMEVDLRPDWSVRLRGPVEEVCVGELTPGFVAGAARFAPVPAGRSRPRGR